jgi:hypothetical protein
MTKDEAIEKCARALCRSYNFREGDWKIQTKQRELATDIVTALEALRLLPEK